MPSIGFIEVNVIEGEGGEFPISILAKIEQLMSNHLSVANAHPPIN